MKPHLRFALLAGAALVLDSGAAVAQVTPPPPPPDMYGPGPMHGRLADRALRDFDLNKDGQISRTEMDKALAQRFSEATGGGATMTEARFAKAHEVMLREHTDEMFHRSDWNGDGMLSLDEFRAPLRARFSMMDRDGTGTISCAQVERHNGESAMKGRGRGPGKMHGHGHRGGHFRGGFVKMCQEADLNKDGKVTRAEFDKAVADKYAAAVKAGSAMTPNAFYHVELGRFQNMEADRYKRIDKNNDGKLSESEFAAPGQKLFAQLDKNKDGVLSKDELMHPRHGHRDRQDGKPK